MISKSDSIAQLDRIGVYQPVALNNCSRCHCYCIVVLTAIVLQHAEMKWYFLPWDISLSAYALIFSRIQFMPPSTRPMGLPWTIASRTIADHDNFSVSRNMHFMQSFQWYIILPREALQIFFIIHQAMLPQSLYKFRTLYFYRIL